MVVELTAYLPGPKRLNNNNFVRTDFKRLVPIPIVRDKVNNAQSNKPLSGMSILSKNRQAASQIWTNPLYYRLQESGSAYDLLARQS